ncbi:MAG: transcription termination/antitermination protein NusG [Rhodospirillales bacterium]|nr:transcription termination/antitermination protein NusG [Rhodospirillales bacterium]MDE0711490.1 transcription termination/antitermination protein NusG [Rhodospirillales bacterium]
MPLAWYIVHAHSGFESRVADTIRAEAVRHALADEITEAVVPTENVVELRQGKKIETERKFFPGYVLVRMQLSDQTRRLVLDVPRVLGFVGTEGDPIPISDDEAGRVLNQIREGVERPRPAVIFEIGENVRVGDGPFTSFNGVVEEIDEERSRVKVSVSIFGRATPVELEYSQVEKI